jgi:hypothetical protein
MLKILHALGHTVALVVVGGLQTHLVRVVNLVVANGSGLQCLGMSLNGKDEAQTKNKDNEAD